MFLDKIKEKFNLKGEKNNKKQLENIIFLIILLVVVVIIINKVWKTDNKYENNNENDISLAGINETKKDDSLFSYYGLQNSLEDMLKTINGVGKVKVLINYSETSTLLPLYNETITESSTKEEDTSGGQRNIVQTDTQKEVAYSQENGNSGPITQKVIMPTIEGAIITAEGAANATVKSNIIAAVEAVTGLSSHKIQVFQMEMN